MATLQFRKERGVADVLNVTFRFIRDAWKILLKSLLYLTVPVYVFGFAVMMIGYLPVLQSIVGQVQMGAASPSPEFGGAMLLTILFMVVTFFVGGAVATTTVLGVVRLYDERGPGKFDVTDVWGVVKQRTGTVLLMTLMISLAFIVAAPLAMVPCLGILVLLALLIVVMTKYFFVGYPVAVLEDKGVWRAIQRAGSLSQNQMWATFGVLVITYIVINILSTIFSIPMYAAMFSDVLFGGESGEVGLIGGGVTFLLLLTSVGGSLLLTSLVYVAGAMQYYNLAERKEQSSLRGRVAEMEAEMEADVEPSTVSDSEDSEDSEDGETGEEDRESPSSPNGSTDRDAPKEEAGGDEAAEDASDDTSRWRRRSNDEAPKNESSKDEAPEDPSSKDPSSGEDGSPSK